MNRSLIACCRTPSATPPGVKKALNRTVESSTAHSGIVLVQFFDDTANILFLLPRTLIAGRHLRVHAVEEFPELLPGLLPMHHRHRPQENAVLDRLRFEIIALFQMELFAQFGWWRRLPDQTVRTPSTHPMLAIGWTYLSPQATYP